MILEKTFGKRRRIIPYVIQANLWIYPSVCLFRLSWLQVLSLFWAEGFWNGSYGHPGYSLDNHLVCSIKNPEKLARLSAVGAWVLALHFFPISESYCAHIVYLLQTHRIHGRSPRYQQSFQPACRQAGKQLTIFKGIPQQRYPRREGPRISILW